MTPLDLEIQRKAAEDRLGAQKKPSNLERARAMKGTRKDVLAAQAAARRIEATPTDPKQLRELAHRGRRQQSRQHRRSKPSSIDRGFLPAKVSVEPYPYPFELQGTAIYYRPKGPGTPLRRVKNGEIEAKVWLKAQEDLQARLREREWQRSKLNAAIAFQRHVHRTQAQLRPDRALPARAASLQERWRQREAIAPRMGVPAPRAA